LNGARKGFIMSKPLPNAQTKQAIPLWAWLISGALFALAIAVVVGVTVFIAILALDRQRAQHAAPPPTVRAGPDIEKRKPQEPVEDPRPVEEPPKEPPIKEVVPPLPAPPLQVTPGFTPLFNGKDLTGWKLPTFRPEAWRVEHGILLGTTGEKHLSRLYTDKPQPRDFHLRVELKRTGNGWGDVCVRSPVGSMLGYQATIHNLNGDTSAGSLVSQLSGRSKGLPRLDQAGIPFDQWFTLEIIADGNHLMVLVDGKKTIDCIDSTVQTAGHVALGLFPDCTLAFRKVEIKDLTPIAAPPVVKAGEFVSLFNGKDLTGWQQHLFTPGDWRVIDGILTGGGKTHGHLLTLRDDYADYHLRVKARFSGVGANGVPHGVRMRAQLDGVNVWGYHVMINDVQRKTGAMYVRSNNLQTPKGNAIAVRPGEWFELDVIVQGDHVIVQVNGLTTADFFDMQHIVPKGPIVLSHAGQAKFEVERIEVKEMNVKPAPAKGFLARLPTMNTAKWRVEGNELVEDQLKGSMHLFFGDPQWTDYDFSVDLQRTQSENQVALLFRCPKDFEGHIFALGLTNPAPYLGGRLKTGGIVDRAPLLDLQVKPLENDRWYTAKVSVRGDKALCYLDGVKLFEIATNETPAGGVGLRTWFAPCRFKNLKVTARDGKILLEGLPDFTLKPPPLPALVLPQGGEFVSLFNGKDLAGWKPFTNKTSTWSVENGCIIGSGPSAGRLHSPRDDYQDFHLRIEARVADQSAGSIAVRAPFSPFKGYEAVVNSNHALDARTGSLQGRVPGKPINLAIVAESPVPAGEWFTMEIIAHGDRIAIRVNGITTADYPLVDPEYRAGHIVLQHQGRSMLEIRKLEIREFVLPR
jgi:hypothetical protein